MSTDLSDQAILITGGAGYIGSHIVHTLHDLGARPVVIDTLENGVREVVPDDVPFLQADIRETDTLTTFMREQQVSGVIHMAAYATVSESVADPLAYYRNNVDGTASVLEACEGSGVQHIVFSSTCAVYGSVGDKPVDEATPIKPESPYGESKAMAEKIIREMSDRRGLRTAILRYFNVVGADPAARAGLCDPKSVRLFPKICEAVTGKIDRFMINGTDYDTADGTAVRDYIHVSDLAEIHIQVLAYLLNGGESVTLNCGYGRGYSVREVVETAKAVSGVDFPVQEAPRRSGDPSSIVADNSRLKTLIEWEPKHDDLAEMLRHDLDWHKHYFSNEDKISGL